MEQLLYLDKPRNKANEVFIKRFLCLNLIIVFCVLSQICFGQDLNYINPLIAKSTFNPALTAISGEFSYGAQHKSQWLDAGGIYKFHKTNAFVNLPFCNMPLNTGLNMQTQWEGEGSLKTTQLNANLSYQISNNTGQNEDKPIFAIGTKIGFVNSHVNWNKLVFSDQINYLDNTQIVSSAIQSPDFQTWGWDYELGFVFEINIEELYTIDLKYNKMNSGNYEIPVSSNIQLGSKIAHLFYPNNRNTVSFYGNELYASRAPILSSYIDVLIYNSKIKKNQFNSFQFGFFVQSNIGLAGLQSNYTKFNSLNFGIKSYYYNMYLSINYGIADLRSDDKNRMKFTSVTFAFPPIGRFSYFISYESYFKKNIRSQYPSIEFGIVFKESKRGRFSTCALSGGSNKNGLTKCPNYNKKYYLRDNNKN